jgi:hypothetical protein
MSGSVGRSLLKSPPPEKITSSGQLQNFCKENVVLVAGQAALIAEERVIVLPP